MAKRQMVLFRVIGRVFHKDADELQYVCSIPGCRRATSSIVYIAKRDQMLDGREAAPTLHCLVGVRDIFKRQRSEWSTIIEI